jgi:peptidyl-prolyl cis-trans isomerase B (cyclophilin B)
MISGMKRIETVSRVVTLSFFLIATSFLIQPAHAEENPKTSLEFCKVAKSVPHNPIKIPAQKNTTFKLPSTMTIVTNCGNIEIALETQLAPVTVSKLTILAKNKFFDNSLCHRLTTSGIFVLQCGDPSGGKGLSPVGWKEFQDENLPAAAEKNYPAGTVAMANRGPKTNATQFFIVYKDSTLPPNYSVWGQIKSGLDIVVQIGNIGAYQVNRTNKKAYYVGDGIPIQPIEIKRVTTS